MILSKEWIKIRDILISLLIFVTFTGQVLISTVEAEADDHIRIISISPRGTNGNQASYHPSISSTGRFISYLSSATNLVQDKYSLENSLYLHDQLSGKTTHIVENILVGQISANGRILVITPNGESQTPYLHDLMTKNITSLSENLNHEIPSTRIKVFDISSDGRYGVVAAPYGINLPIAINNEPNSLYFFDRINNQLINIPLENNHIDISPGSCSIALSGDGRFVAFLTKGNKYSGQIKNQEILIYNRVMGQIDALQLPASVDNGGIFYSGIDISETGDIIAIGYSQTQHGSSRIIVLDRRIAPDRVLLNTNLESTGFSLSADGRYLVAVHPSTSKSSELIRYHLTSGKKSIIDKGIIDNEVDISQEGSKIVYSKDVDGILQVHLWDENPILEPSYILSGRVTDSTGFPLAQVSIEGDSGHISNTDHDGYFWINGIKSGKITLKPEKKGFEFSPGMISFDVITDTHNLDYVYAHKELLEEAEIDLGMPYSKNRGSDGPYHGYSAGYCTDLILDAFTWGLDFDIRFALEMDYKAHPWHSYRWRDARDAHDMWRYFSYSGQIHPHQDPYQPGDIVFFDWDDDGEIDHVALISQVDYRNRPEMIFDATGVIYSNPNGLAEELEWESFHEETARGFARWSGLYEPIIVTSPQVEILQFTVNGDQIIFRLLDDDGAAISTTENGIFGGKYNDLVYEQSISIIEPFSPIGSYLLILVNDSDVNIAYKFSSQFLINDLVADRIEFSDNISYKEIKSIPILVKKNPDGKVSLIISNSVRRIEGELP